LSQLLTVRSTSSLRENLDAWRAVGCRVALVPTMGNLHAGHLSLTDRARLSADRVVCSVFVNPMQFGVGEDFENYPRTADDDAAALAEQGAADLLYLPDVDAIYPYGTDSALSVQLPRLSEDLCGAARTGHFNGVASVVLRLINLVNPDVLVLGDKDYQQRILLERMVTDLHLPTEVVGAAIYREPDGLAMSSRNVYLSAEERSVAPTLYTSLLALADALRKGETNYSELESATIKKIAALGFEPEYVAVRRVRDLVSAEIFGPGDERIVLGAAQLGRARLIDNVRV
jgi:pantoate--beta-alanine ligase